MTFLMQNIPLSLLSHAEESVNIGPIIFCGRIKENTVIVKGKSHQKKRHRIEHCGLGNKQEFLIFWMPAQLPKNVEAIHFAYFSPSDNVVFKDTETTQIVHFPLKCVSQ